MAVTDTLINTIFDGRYRIVSKLGAGGMANVYLAEDQELGRHVAIKILNERHSNDEQFVERFRREAKNAAGLSHPNIVSIYDRGEADGSYYIAMEYLDGRTLKELITSRGPAPIQLAIDYARQILAALRVSHRRDLVHRDIKPHNVLVDGEDRLKVTDFGIARSGPSQMTEAGSIIGTAQYLSPEQAQGAPVTAASDLYSLGIVLYELLTGKVPFSGETPVEIAMKHLSAAPEPPSKLRPDIPHDLDLVVMRALAKDPAQRYQSAEEMDADLARVSRGVAVSPVTEETATAIIARPITSGTGTSPGVPPPGYPPEVYYDLDEPIGRRRSIWPWLLALLLIVAAVGAGVYAYQQIRDELDATKSVAVGDYVGIREPEAVSKIVDDGFVADVNRVPSNTVEATFVIRQDPAAGNRQERGSTVTIFVSTGKAMTTVPDVRGKTRDDAVAEIVAAKLDYRIVEINSGKPVNTVTAQDPKPGEKVAQGTQVRINVSIGPAEFEVPSVVGESFAQASSEIQARGFRVARRDADADAPEGTVIHQSPDAGSLAQKGATVTLTVSKGPQTVAVPSVEGLDADAAVAAIEEAGFVPNVVDQDVTDENLDNLVLSQTPASGAQAKPGSTVTVTVGRFLPPDTALP
jgi:eukaryotic-like serine/threonine-protein kinase